VREREESETESERTSERPARPGRVRGKWGAGGVLVLLTRPALAPLVLFGGKIWWICFVLEARTITNRKSLCRPLLNLYAVRLHFKKKKKVQKDQ
jgi:hypothetical protein